MNKIFLDKNIELLNLRFPKIAQKILQAKPSENYLQDYQIAKTGEPIPILKDGKSIYSKYNPIRDVEKIFSNNEEFILFCGLGSGIQIDIFFSKFKNNYCAITENSYSDFKALFTQFDFTKILNNKNVFFLPPFTEDNFTQALIEIYIPVLYGNFSTKILRAWENFHTNKISILSKKIQEAIDKIKADVSTQKHFGKIWMRNIFLNLQTASSISPKFPTIDKNKTAFILGAGPSLENSLEEIKQNRDKFILFATDTSFPVLNKALIEPDFFISIDPQIISYNHSFRPFTENCIGIFDLCANPIIAKEFLKNGNNIFFGIGGHPFAQLAAKYSPLPFLVTSGGSVAITAKFVAISLGLKKIKYSGLDFSYTKGKAYSRETYLSKLFDKTANKISPIESKFIDLMFRTPITSVKEKNKISYTTKLLNSYKDFFFNNNLEKTISNESKYVWKAEDFKTFDFSTFIKKLRIMAKAENPHLLTCFLPYFAYKSTKKIKKNTIFCNLELVLSDFSEYTVGW